MIDYLRKVIQTDELRVKIVWTLLLLAVCRIGVFIPVPGINGELALNLFKYATKGSQNLFQLIDIFSGGAFSQMTVFALGVMPYISASIVMQVMTIAIPGMQKEMRENPEAGRKKMVKYTRILTILISFFQATLYAKYTIIRNAATPGIILPEILGPQIMGMPWVFYLVTTITMTAGTAFLMWVGEQITEKGIGNGVSLIITLGILSRLPSVIGSLVGGLNLDSQEIGATTLTSLVLLSAIFVAVIIGTIYLIQGERRIPIQYARRVVGRKEMQGQGQPYLPLKVNYAGVIPVIFASAFLTFPAMIFQFLGEGSGWLDSMGRALSPGATFYTATYMLLIFFFTYFWTATQFHPDQIASDMKKNAAFIPGVKQGSATAKYLKNSMTRITFFGATSLVLIAILPMIISRLLKIDPLIAQFFGGTSLLILVGVILDTTKQVDSHMLSKRYDGLMRKGRSKYR